METQCQFASGNSRQVLFRSLSSAPDEQELLLLDAAFAQDGSLCLKSLPSAELGLSLWHLLYLTCPHAVTGKPLCWQCQKVWQSHA